MRGLRRGQGSGAAVVLALVLGMAATTMIDTHVLKRGGRGVTSPADVL